MYKSSKIKFENPFQSFFMNPILLSVFVENKDIEPLKKLFHPFHGTKNG